MSGLIIFLYRLKLVNALQLTQLVVNPVAQSFTASCSLSYCTDMLSLTHKHTHTHNVVCVCLSLGMCCDRCSCLFPLLTVPRGL